MEDENYNYINMSFDYDYDDYRNPELVLNVVHWIIICSGFPLILVAIAAVYSLAQKDQAAPVYVINLLMSDFVQLCCLTAWKAGELNFFADCAYFFGVMVSVGFMVCISMERYLLITQPLWYRFRRNIKTAVLVCIVVWILPLVYVLPLYLNANFQLSTVIFVIFLLLPFPLFLFFLVGTIRALSAARSVPADEKRRIVAVLVMVLLIYTLLFLPGILCLLAVRLRNSQIFNTVSFILINISPLADVMLYVFIRKGVADKLLASLCCCKMSTNQQTSSMSTASCSQTI